MNTRPNSPNTPNKLTILRRRVGGFIGGVALLAAGTALAQGIASGASTNRLMGQLENQKAGAAMDDYTKGKIDTNAVKVIETGDKPVLAWDEARSLESNPDNIQPLTDMIHDQAGGDTVPPHAALVLPKDLIKSSVQQVK